MRSNTNIILPPAHAPGKGYAQKIRSRVPLYFRDFAAYLLNSMVVYRLELERVGVDWRELDQAHGLKQPRRSHCASTK